MIYDTDKADEIWAILLESAPHFREDCAVRRLAGTLFGNSPYLAGLSRRYPNETIGYLAGGAQDHLVAILDSLAAPRPDGEKTPDLMAFLRGQKNRLALLTAVADLSGEWPLEDVTLALSRFADAAMDTAIGHLLHMRMVAGELAWPNGQPEPASPKLTAGCGFFLIGMGKLGAFELNYSSDIDLIALYDPDRVKYTGKKNIAACYVKLTQEVMQIMEQRTMHGYVFRTDLRLRPDPGATPVALSMDAALNYYQSMAVNWERSAMIKARISAGDKTSGEEFLAIMSRWVWRKSMDFNALKDIAAIKNQINRHYAQAPATFRGLDVKLGYGGIREIEFFAQTNQLLHAGRHPWLRCRGTLDALEGLANEKLISPTVLRDLMEGYRYLRTLEHRIQMINDEQTHSIPSDDASLQRLATFMGFNDLATFEAETKKYTDAVSKHYDAFLPDDEVSAVAEGYSEAQLPQKLEKLGFDDISTSAQLIDGWRRGRYRALRSERAKQLLEQILPGMLAAFSETHRPSSALARFDKFISQLPAGVQLFSLLQTNPSLFKLLARVMGLAPALAELLAKKPSMWDAVLEPDFYAPLEGETELTAKLKILLDSAGDYQDVLDTVRRFVAEHKFRTGVQLMEGLANVEEIGSALARLADITLKCLVPMVEKEFRDKHGTFPGGGLSIIAMGKYGGKELTHTSDLDIVFLYSVPDMEIVSDGKKPLGPSQYFSRLSQHVITAITALTPEGRLYEVDTRLRPSGSQGPLVVTLKTFSEYYCGSAWEWEHMALTRARLILGPLDSAGAIHNTIQTILTAPRDQEALLLAVADMRRKLFNEFGSDNPWAIKHCRGGLVDMEFICQYLMLRDGNHAAHLFHPNLRKSIARLAHVGSLTSQQADAMQDAYSYMQRIQSILRLCIGGSPSSDDEIPLGLRATLCQAVGGKKFSELRAQLVSKQSAIYSLFTDVIERPSKQLQPKE